MTEYIIHAAKDSGVAVLVGQNEILRKQLDVAIEALHVTHSMSDMRHQIVDFPMMQFHRIRKIAEDAFAEIERLGGEK